MKNWQQRKNEEFFEMIIGITKNGGTYISPAARTSYIIKGKKIICDSPYAFRFISDIVSSEWAKNNLLKNYK